MGGRYSLGIDEQIDVFFDIASSLLSGTNNEIGANKEFSDCEGNKYLGVVQSVNSGADFVSMATPGTAIGDLAKKYGKRLGVLQLLIKKLNGDEPTIGDYCAAAASFVSGPLAIGLTIVGLGYTILSYKEDPPRACPNPNRNRNDENPNLKDAKNASSPIILDLNGDGIKTTGIASWRYFDHDQSGFAEMTAWADKNDGILALDLNGNGKIDDGREIFGNNTFLPDGTLAPHGYAALSQYDSNHDGKIDSHDEIWEKLRVWRDKNEDAKTGKNELHTLDELGIAAINLNAEEVSETDEAGNRVTHRATVTKTDGTTMASADVWFNVNTAQTRFLGDETVSEDIAALPNVKGFGNVPSLHVAMNKDSKLKEMVETYLSTDSEHRDALLPEIIYKWTGSENIVSNSRGRHIDARTLAALERLTGDTFLQNGRDPNPNTNAARILQDEFDKFSRYTEAKILLQKPEYANARSIMDFLIDRADANDEPVNWDLFAQYLSQVNKAGQTEKVKTEYRLIEGSLTYSSKYKDSLQDFFTEHFEDYSELFFSGVIKSITGDETSNTLVGSSKSDAILGLAGDDTLEGNAGNDYLNGGLGNDKLYGGAGHDTLDGGSGNDYMDGGSKERDTYLFRAGHGKDTVSDYAIEDKDADTLRFSGAKAADSRYRREGYHLIVNAYGENDAVTLNNYFHGDNYQRYNFQFDDATFKAAELRGKDLPTEGLKAPVAATAQADAATPDSATAAVTPQEKAATATTDDSKAQVANTPEKIVAVDTFHPPLQLHKDGAASTDAVQKADSATVSGNDAGKNVLAAQTPADTKVQSAATDTATQAAVPASGKATQIAAATSVDSSAVSKADTQNATVQQNAESVEAALKAGGATATPASTLDAKAAQQSQQMLSAMATQSQTATPTALAAPDLQPKPQLVASQV